MPAQDQNRAKPDLKGVGELHLICPVSIEPLMTAEGMPRTGPRRFVMQAYNGGPVELDDAPLPVVFDIKSLKIPRAKMPIYGGHPYRGEAQDRIVGHSDQHDKGDGSRLVVAGAVSGATDQARQILESHDAGFPWQASIAVLPLRSKMSVLEAGKTAKINGRDVTGPLILVRSGTYRHTAFVPEGADETTSVTIAAKAATSQRSSSMEFQEWLEASGFALGELTDKNVAFLQARFDAEMKATKKADAMPTMQAQRSDDGFNLSEFLVAHEQLNARIDCERTKYLEKVPAPKLVRLHRDALQAAAELKLKVLEERWAAAKVEVEAIKCLAGFEKKLVEATMLDGPPISAHYLGENFDQVMQAAFCRNAGLGNWDKRFPDPIKEAADRCRGVGLQELLLQCAHRNGYGGRMMITDGNLREVMQAAFSTSTVTTLLTQAGDKFLLDGFERVEQRWREVASIRSVSNFRQHTGFRLTADMEYAEVPASGELQHGDTGQESWTIQAKTYGRIFVITRADIINDDLGAFDALRTRIGMGGAMKMNKVFWTAWLAAVNGAAFWTTARGNYQSGATTVLGDASLSTAVTLFRQMQGPDGNLLDLEPDRLLVPPELEATARKLFVSQEARDTTANTRLMVANIHQNRFRPIIVPQLSNSGYTGYSTTHWFLCANPAVLASAEVAFLNGREQPVVESSDADFNTLGISLRAYHDFGVAMSEYRASVLTAGA